MNLLIIQETLEVASKAQSTAGSWLVCLDGKRVEHESKPSSVYLRSLRLEDHLKPKFHGKAPSREQMWDKLVESSKSESWLSLRICMILGDCISGEEDTTA